jgi:hypothetical protein
LELFELDQALALGKVFHDVMEYEGEKLRRKFHECKGRLAGVQVASASPSRVRAIAKGELG